MKTRRRQALIAVSIAASALVAGAVTLSSASASVSTQTQVARDMQANCQILADNSSGTQQQRARACVTDQTRILQLLGAAPTSTPTVAPTTPEPTTPAPTTAPPTTTPPTTAPPASGWPGASNTGVPAGTTLTNWTGSCNITTPGLVIDARTLNCDVVVRAANVSFTRTRINGSVSNDSEDDRNTFSMTDSEVNATPGAVREWTGVSSNNFKLLRVEITGGNRGVYCARTCDIRDSWIHGQRITADWHASAVRMEQGLTLIHNTLVCDAPVQANPEGSCSASLTGYGDYAPVRNNLIQGNYFAATQYAAFCAYGGSSKGKPFSSGAENIRFVDNVFEHGSSSTNRDCALYGPIGDWDPTRPGNVWTNNHFSDGALIPNVAS